MNVTKDVTMEDLGTVGVCEEIEIGGRRVTRLVQPEGDSCISTIIIRGASLNIMNEECLYHRDLPIQHIPRNLSYPFFSLKNYL